MSASSVSYHGSNSAETASNLLPITVEPSHQILISEKEYLTLKNEIGYWKSLHKKAIDREKVLKQKVKEQEGQIRDLKNRVFGKKSEKKTCVRDKCKQEPESVKRPRGQQPGSQGHGRTQRPDLPKREEEVGFPEDPVCPCCGLPYIDDGYTQEEIIEVEVKAHTRVIKRSRRKKSCKCQGVPQKMTAPQPLKLFPKSPYGISIWVEALLTKFRYSHPTNRFLNYYKDVGCTISPGTIAGGLKRLKKLFQPVYDALYSRQMREDRFHNDESGWKVFESVEGKVGNRWWLWVSRSESVIYFQIAQSRGADIVVEHFKNILHAKIIVICDRYSAYKSLARQLVFVILAFCWAHVRRDFLDAARKYPKLENWALSWVEDIAGLYHINNLRCKAFDKQIPVQWQSATFKEHHNNLVEKMDKMVKKRDSFIEINQSDTYYLTQVKCKILISLKTHWEGLEVFVGHPEVPMDNNNGENAIRNPVTGRKNFYGSGSLWSSELAAMMFSTFQTLGLHGINQRHWLNSYLNSCAENKGKAPEDLSPFLPWEMEKERRHKLSKPFDTIS